MTTVDEGSSARTVFGFGLGTRILFVVVVLGAILLTRFDTAVDFIRQREGTDTGVIRLAGFWPVVYVGLSALVALAVILFLYFGFRSAQAAAYPTTTKGWEAKRAAALKVNPIGSIGVILGIVGVMMTTERFLFVIGKHTFAGLPIATALTIAVWLQVLVLVLGIVVIARMYVAPELRTKDDAWKGVREIITRHRAMLTVIAIYVAGITVMPILGEQTADALRLLSFTGDSPGAATMLVFLLVTAFLVSAVTLQSWRLLDRRPAAGPRRICRAAWAIAGLVIAAVGGIIWLFGFTTGAYSFSAAIFWLGVLIGLVAFIAGPREKGGIEQKVADALDEDANVVAAYVAAVPLLGLAAAIFAAIFDLTVPVDVPDGLQIAGPATAALLLLLVAVLMTRQINEAKRLTFPAWTTRWPLLFAVGVVVVILLGFALVFDKGRGWVLALAIVLALVLAGYLWSATGANGVSDGRPERSERFARLAARFEAHRSWADFTVLTGFVAGVTAIVAVHLDAIPNSRLVGTVALINAFAALLLALSHYLSVFAARFKPPLGLEFIGFRHMPVLTFLLAWWVIAGLVLPGSLHDVRVVTRQTTEASPTLETAFASWLDAQPEFETDGTGIVVAPEQKEDATIPLVIVASHGGGIRAAYWTGLIMDCMVGRAPQYGVALTGTETCAGDRRTSDAGEAASRIFLGSGVSGGGVGLAAYSLQLKQGGLSDEWVDDRLNRDLLAPVVGWGLFHDLPNHLLGLEVRDRAGVLEDELDAAHGAATDSSEVHLRDLWTQRSSDDAAVANIAKTIPLLVINSSLSDAPYRSTASAANLSGDSEGTADVIDSLCPTRDIRVSTAAVLGARFPIISPSGTIAGGCGGSDDDGDKKSKCGSGDGHQCALQMVDGGYLDNSGMTTIANLWPELKALVDGRNAAADEAKSKDPAAVTVKIAMVVVDVDNEYVDPGIRPVDPAPEGETLLPLTVRLGGADALQETGTDVVKAAAGEHCYFSIVPQLKPGLTAPLGWALSEASRASLVDGIPPTDPEEAGDLAILQDWLGAGDRPGAQLRSLEDCIPG